MLEITNLTFGWQDNKLIFDRLSLKVEKEKHLFIQGKSGSGKTTLLNLITGIYTTKQGKIKVLGEDLHRLSPRARDEFRALHFGIIFQQFNLIPYLSVLENVLLPHIFIKKKSTKGTRSARAIKQEAQQLLTKLQINPSLFNQPSNQISVGQAQRVAVARALIGSPAIIIADEPTSSLDTANRDGFLKILFEECQDATLIFVSHDESLKQRFSHSIQL